MVSYRGCNSQALHVWAQKKKIRFCNEKLPWLERDEIINVPIQGLLTLSTMLLVDKGGLCDNKNHFNICPFLYRFLILL